MTREEVIKHWEEALLEMTPAQQDEVIITCACGGCHQYTPRAMVEAMKDPDNEEGQRWIKAAIELKTL